MTSTNKAMAVVVIAGLSLLITIGASRITGHALLSFGPSVNTAHTQAIAPAVPTDAPTDRPLPTDTVMPTDVATDTSVPTDTVVPTVAATDTPAAMQTCTVTMQPGGLSYDVTFTALHAQFLCNAEIVMHPGAVATVLLPNGDAFVCSFNYQGWIVQVSGDSSIQDLGPAACRSAEPTLSLSIDNAMLFMSRHGVH